MVAELGPGAACGASTRSVAGVILLPAEVAPHAGSGTVASAFPGIGVCPPQASKAARIASLVRRGNFNIQEIISIVISEFRFPYG